MGTLTIGITLRWKKTTTTTEKVRAQARGITMKMDHEYTKELDDQENEEGTKGQNINWTVRTRRKKKKYFS